MKKAIMGVLILAAGTVSAVSPAVATTYPAGDANCSGTVTQTDAYLVIDVILERGELGDCNPHVDLNCSGTLTPVDAYLISRIVTSGYVPPVCS